MNGSSLDASWRRWLQENIERRCCPPEELLGILINDPFSLDAIREGMGDYFPTHPRLLDRDRKQPGPIDYSGLCVKMPG